MLLLSRLAPQIVLLTVCALLLLFLPHDRMPGFGAYTLPRSLLWLIAGINLVDLLLAARTRAVSKRSPEKKTIWGAMGLVAAFLIAAAVLRTLGFAISAALLFGACGWIMGFRNPWLLAIISIAAALAAWFVFSFAIDLSLPVSPLSRDI